MTSHRIRTGLPQWGSEAVATFGLLAVIFGCAKARSTGSLRRRRLHHGRLLVHELDVLRQPGRDPRRSLTDTFSGIRPQDVPGFVAGQVVGAALATATFGWLAPLTTEDS
jgi:glycerol uptake facilitator-like aquaporin